MRLLPIAYCLLPLALAACAGTPPQPVIVSEPPTPIHVAPECLSPDPAWTDLPDRDVTQSELARLWRRNRQAYRSIVAARAVCRVSIRAQLTETPGGG